MKCKLTHAFAPSLALTLGMCAAAALAPVQALAQGRSFEGFSMSLNAESVRSTSEYGGTDSASSSGGNLQLGYSLGLGPQFVLGLGVTAGIGNRNAGSVAGTDFSTKNFASFDITPGWAVSDSLLLYGKISSANTTGLYTTGGVETSTSLSGVGYGIGLRAMIDKHLYFQVGLDAITFDNKSIGALTLKSSANAGSVGLGYKF